MLGKQFLSQAWCSSVSAENPEISIWTGIVKDLIGMSLTIFAFYFLKKEHILGINLFFTSRKTRPINEREHKTKFRISRTNVEICGENIAVSFA